MVIGEPQTTATAAARPTFLRWLQTALQVQPGEGRRVSVMILYSAAAVGGVLTVGLTVSNTLFLSGLPASAAPYLFILPAISIAPSLLLYNRLAARFSLTQLIIGSNAFLLGGVVLFRVLLGTPLGKGFAVLAALHLSVEVAYTLAILQFWSLAGEVFDPREAKRLFGLIASGGALAKIVAGLSLAALVRVIGVSNLLWVVAGALAVCMACAWTLGRTRRQAASARHPPAASAPGRKSLKDDLRAIAQSPLLLAIGGLTILVSLLINVTAYEFYLALQASFAGRATEMAAYLGAFEFWAGLAGFGMQVYFAGRVMSRFGVFAALLFFPLGIALGAGLSLLTSQVLLAITLIIAADPAFRRTINSAALNVLYLPISPVLQQRARELFETLYAVTFGMAGVVFLLLRDAPGWKYLYYSFPLLALAVLWLALLPWTRRQYTRALADSLKRRLLDLDGTTLSITDETTVQVLAAALRHSDELRVLNALQLIAGAPAVNWDQHVAPLLAHPSAAVRLQALQYLGRQGNARYAETVGALLGAPEADVRAAAVAALCAMVGLLAIPRVTPLLVEADPRVKGAVVIGLITHGSLDGVRRATVELKGMLDSDDPLARQEGARAIGVIRAPAFYAPLVPLLDDVHREVRLSAIRAAGALASRDMLLHLIRKLRDKTTVLAAVEALAHAGRGGGIEVELEPVLSDPVGGPYVPRLLQRMRTRSAVDLLLAHFDSADEIIRGEVYQALARLRMEGVGVHLAEDRLRAALLDELRSGYLWIVRQADLGADGSDVLMTDAIRVRLSLTLDRVFHLLNLLYPDSFQQIQRVRHLLGAEQSHTRALALEFLDNLAERQVAELLLPLVEAPVERALEVAQKRLALPRRSLGDRLSELAGGSDVWLRACAIARIGVLRQTELAEPVLAALDSDDALLRETALAACRTLLDPARFTALLKTHAADNRFPLVQRYAQSLISNN